MHSARPKIRPATPSLNPETLRLFETLIAPDKTIIEKRQIAECLLEGSKEKRKLPACEDLAVQLNARYQVMLPGRNEPVYLTLRSAAAYSGDIELYTLVVKHEPSKVVKDNTPSALHIASFFGHTVLIIHLVEQHQYDPNARYTYVYPNISKNVIHSESCISLAVKKDHAEAANALLLRGALPLHLPPIRSQSQCALLLQCYDSFMIAIAEFRKGEQSDPVTANGYLSHALTVNRNFVIDYLGSLIKKINESQNSSLEANHTFIPDIILLILTLIRTRKKIDQMTFKRLQEEVVKHLLGYNADSKPENPGKKLFCDNNEKTKFLEMSGLLVGHSIAGSFEKMRGEEKQPNPNGLFTHSPSTPTVASEAQAAPVAAKAAPKPQEST